MGSRGLPILICGLLCAGVAQAQTLTEANATASGTWAWSSPPLPVTAPPVTAPQAVTAGAPQQGKSTWAAAGLSLLLPGAGHFYAGAPGRGKIFVGAEAVIWSMALVFDRREAWKGDDAVDWAVAHAELDPAGKDDEFLEKLESYQNRDEYNKAGRVIDPSRPFVPETADTYWQWDSSSNRNAYQDLRNSADTAGRNRTFTFYAALLNRVVSAVDAFRTVHRNNAKSKSQEGLKLSLESNASGSDSRILMHARLSF